MKQFILIFSILFSTQNLLGSSHNGGNKQETSQKLKTTKSKSSLKRDLLVGIGLISVAAITYYYLTRTPPDFIRQKLAAAHAIPVTPAKARCAAMFQCHPEIEDHPLSGAARAYKEDPSNINDLSNPQRQWLAVVQHKAILYLREAEDKPNDLARGAIYSNLLKIYLHNEHRVELPDSPTTRGFHFTGDDNNPNFELPDLPQEEHPIVRYLDDYWIIPNGSS